MTTNLQNIFDRVVTHLLTQNAKALDDAGYCTYRGFDGRMCAIGCLIPPERYEKFLEGKSATSSVVLTAIGFDLNVNDYTRRFLEDLQAIHDNAIFVKEWPERLSYVAYNYNLQIPNILFTHLSD